MRVWLYGANNTEVCELVCGAAHRADTAAGTSTAAVEGSAFPKSGLTPAICAAMREEIDALVVSRWTLLGTDTAQIEQTKALFAPYGVRIKSASSHGSSSS